MKKLLSGVVLVLLISALFVPLAYADVWVNGYYRSNGTYVQGHYRSSPDGNPYNNWSYPGNTNPYTGVTAGGNSSTYLKNYYNSSLGNTYSYSSPSISYPQTPSCPSMSSYDSLSGDCKCWAGYIVGTDYLGKESCVSASLLCSRKIGLMSQYNSLSKQCECMAGYELNGSTCERKKISYDYSYSSGYYTGSGTCPANSHESLTDSDKCACDTGFRVNSKKDACIPVSNKSSDKICKEEFGSKSKWAGTTNSNGTVNCVCRNGYEFNKKGSRCVQAED